MAAKPGPISREQEREERTTDVRELKHRTRTDVMFKPSTKTLRIDRRSLVVEGSVDDASCSDDTLLIVEFVADGEAVFDAVTRHGKVEVIIGQVPTAARSLLAGVLRNGQTLPLSLS
jgi:hypothetical protein